MKQRDDSAQVLVAEAKAGAAEENGSVIISVTKATKLRSVNITGKSDPFVKVKIMETNGAKVHKTNPTKQKQSFLTPLFR